MRKAVEKMVEKLKSAVNGKKIFCIALYHSGDDDETMTLVSWVKEQISGLSKVLFAGELSAGILVHGGSGIIGIGALVG
jgi:fatty acid-binding protein DegV